MTDTTTMIEQLRAVTYPHRDDERYTPHAEQVARLCWAAADRLEEQSAVVERLPVTADGKPVAQGDTVWVLTGGTWPNGEPAETMQKTVCQVKGYRGCDYWGFEEEAAPYRDPVYATEEAAIEADRQNGKEAKQ